MTSDQTRHRSKQVLFALLSFADFYLTWLLIRSSQGEVYEANPVAGWCLERLGWPGLASFKVGIVLLVLGLTSALSRTRPRVAGRVLLLGSACLAAVVGYSAALGGVVFLGVAEAGESAVVLPETAPVFTGAEVKWDPARPLSVPAPQRKESPLRLSTRDGYQELPRSDSQASGGPASVLPAGQEDPHRLRLPLPQ